MSECASGFSKNSHDRAISSSTKLTTLEEIKGSFHFIGVGGIGMSALARLLIARGLPVSGSDRVDSEIMQELAERGACTSVGHRTENVREAGVVIVSTAIQEDNPELIEAQRRELPIWHRSDMLARLTDGRRLVGISGTHGKTTTTGMAAQVLIDARLDPSVVVGGVFNKIGANSRHGDGDVFVAEIDESDGTQTRVRSHIAVITNVECDHLENYPGGIDEILASMHKFATSTSGELIICLDDPGCRRLLERLRGSSLKIVTYGCHKKSDYRLSSLDALSMKVYKKEKELGEITLSVPGVHNKKNALAALAVALELGVPFGTIEKSLAEFGGVDRRFQVLGEENGITVVDDYAHHPTEVEATLSAAREYLATRTGSSSSRLVAVFQPHQPSRLQNHWDEFVKSFSHADMILVTDIYIARGGPIDGIDSRKFASDVDHENVHYIGGPTEELADAIAAHVRPGDMVMTIGAGDITSVGPALLSRLGDDARSS